MDKSKHKKYLIFLESKITIQRNYLTLHNRFCLFINSFYIKPSNKIILSLRAKLKNLEIETFLIFCFEERLRNWLWTHILSDKKGRKGHPSIDGWPLAIVLFQKNGLIGQQKYYVLLYSCLRQQLGVCSFKQVSNRFQTTCFVGFERFLYFAFEQD